MKLSCAIILSIINLAASSPVLSERQTYGYVDLRSLYYDVDVLSSELILLGSATMMAERGFANHIKSALNTRAILR
jgi:hypothetical protein